MLLYDDPFNDKDVESEANFIAWKMGEFSRELLL